MSYLTCTVCRRRTNGPLGAGYFTLFTGPDKFFRRMRLCSGCLSDIRFSHSGEWVPADSLDDADLIPHLCSAKTCNGATLGVDPLFVVFFPPKAEREDFMAWYCLDHSQAAIASLSLNKET